MIIGKVGDFYEVKGGKRLPKGSSFTENKTLFPYLRVTDFERNGLNSKRVKYIDAETQASIKRYTIDYNSVYISIAGTIGVAGIIPEEFNGANLTENAAKFIPKKGVEVDSKFFSHFLNSFKVQNIIRSKTMAVGVPKLALFRIQEIPIKLPSLKEQKKIAAILDAADSLRQKDQQLIGHYTTLSQSLFLDMFGDPVTNPMNWPKETVESVCEKIFGGGTPSKSNLEYYDGDIPWVTPKDMKFTYINNSRDHINLTAIENSSAKLIKSGAVLMVIRSGILKHTLPVAINLREVAVNQDMKAYIPKLDKTNNQYLLYSLKLLLVIC